MTYTWYVFISAILLLEEVNSAVIDLGHGYQNQSSCWIPTQSFETFDVIKLTDDYWEISESFKTSEHCGTHLDAPFHFYHDGWKLGEIPLERMIIEGVHLNVSQEVNENVDFLLTANHLKQWEQVNGPLPNNCVILVNFGWAHKFSNRKLYYNNGTDDSSFVRFPGLSIDAAQWIVDSGKVFGVGVDVPSVDPGNTKSYDVHRVLAKANLYNLENVALNSTALPPKGFKLIVQPIKIMEGTGGPCRILAFTSSSTFEIK